MTTASSGQPADGIAAFPRLLRNQYWLVGLLLIAAAAMRIYGALNDLSLDEIWSLRLVRMISSPLQLFTKIHDVNNHYLNSLWLYRTGFHGNWPGYRILSIVAGLGSVALAGLIGRRRSVCAAWFAMLLTAFSYVQILCSSEAAGYSEVVLFSFISFYALEEYLDTQAMQSALLFSISSMLGFASNLIFLNVFCAAIIWSGWRFMKSGLGTRRTLKAMIPCHAAPAAFLTALYFVDIRHHVMDGATEHGPGSYVDSFAWALGAPPGHFSMLLTSLLAAALFVAGLRILRREASDAWVFFIGVILVVPILLADVRHSEGVYVRHFIVGMAFLLILCSFVLAALYQRGGRGRIFCVVVLAGYFVLNGWHAISLFKHGRGHYGQAMHYLAEHTKAPVVTVSSDHDYRIAVVLQFYAMQEMGNKQVTYYPDSRMNSWPRGGPEWFISHKESFSDPAPPGMHLADPAGNRYDFVKTFQSAPLSGSHWYIYHNRAK